MRHIFWIKILSKAVCCAIYSYSHKLCKKWLFQYGYMLLLYLYCMPITGDMNYLVSEIKIETCHLMLQLVNGLGNSWVQEPYPAKTLTHGMGMVFAGLGMGCLWVFVCMCLSQVTHGLPLKNQFHVITI